MGRSGRGWSSRKQTWFKKNRKPWNAGIKAAEAEVAKPRVQIKHLTHEDFSRTFQLSDNIPVWTPRCEAVLNPELRSSATICGKLRPLSSEKSHVDQLLLEREEDNDISGYCEIHLPTCVSAIQVCVEEHSNLHPNCKGRTLHCCKSVQEVGCKCNHSAEMQHLFIYFC